MIAGTIQRLVGFAANEITRFATGAEKIVQYYSFDAKSHDQLVRFLDNFFLPDPECPICKKESEVDVADFRWK